MPSNWPYPIGFDIFPRIVFSEEEVLSVLLACKVSFAPGPDGMPSSILRSYAELICEPFIYIFNKSLRKSYSPAAWNDTLIIPLYKNGHREDIESYRRSAKLSVLAELPESLVTKRLLSVIKSVRLVPSTAFQVGDQHLLIYWN